MFERSRAVWLFTMTVAVSLLIACGGQNVTPINSEGNSLRHNSNRSAWGTYPLGYTPAYEIGAVQGPNNSIWLADVAQNVITEISTAGQTSTYNAGNFVFQCCSQPPATPPAEPVDIEMGPNNTTYYLASQGGYGVMAASGSTTLYKMECFFNLPSCAYPTIYAPTSSTMAVTSDGSAWSSGSGVPYGSASYVIRAQGANETLIPVPGGSRYENPPKFFALGPDGNVWFTDVNYLGRVNSSTNQLTTYAIPGSSGAFAGALTAGPDGNLWISHCNEPYDILYATVGGAISSIAVPPALGNLCEQGSHEIIAGPDDDIYFATGGYSISRINVKNHQFSKYNLVPTPRSGYGGVQTAALGADRNIWVFMVSYPDVYVLIRRIQSKTTPPKVTLKVDQSTTVTVKEAGYSKDYVDTTGSSSDCVDVSPSVSSGAFTFTAGSRAGKCYVSFADESGNDSVYVQVTVKR